MSETKILFIADLNYTGYGIATYNLLKNLRNKCEIHYLGINNTNNYQNIDELKNLENITIHYIKDVRKYNELIGLDVIIDVVNNVKPDIIISFNDNHIIYDHFNEIIDKKRKEEEGEKKKPKLVGYMPIDCEFILNDYFKNLENKTDYFITINNFSKNILENTGIKKDIFILEHIVLDLTSYCSLSKIECRKYIFEKYGYKNNGDNEDYRDYFIILNFNNIQERKRLDITIDAFYEFYKKYPNDKIILILKKNENLNRYIDKYINNIIYKDFLKHIIFIDISVQLSFNELSILYNSVDLGINTSVGEGWGLIPCEHAIFGVPQLIPDNTCSRELFENSFYIETELLPYGYSHLKINKEFMNSTCICVAQIKKAENNNIIYLKNSESIDIVQNSCYNILINKHNNSTNVYGVNGLIIFNYITDNINNIKWFKEVEESEEYEYIQIFYMSGEWLNDLQYYDPEILLKIINKEKYFEIKCHKKFELNLFLFKCRVPKIDSLCQLIEMYYNNSNLRYEIGLYQKKLMENKYNKLTIQDKFNEIIKKILL